MRGLWDQSDGPVVSLSDPSAAQIAVGKKWAAVTMSSGSLLQLPLTGEDGVLNGTSNAVTLPSDADMVPLGEAFWGNVLGFTPAHSPDSFAIVDESGNLYPIAGPTPSYPTNAPCWVAKGPGNVWYTGNSPGDAISIFFSDNQGGVFYKSVPLPGSPTDITVSPDRKWLAVIYSASGSAYVSVFAIDDHGDLTPVATSSSIGGVASFSGVAIQPITIGFILVSPGGRRSPGRTMHTEILSLSSQQVQRPRFSDTTTSAPHSVPDTRRSPAARPNGRSGRSRKRRRRCRGSHCNSRGHGLFRVHSLRNSS